MTLFNRAQVARCITPARVALLLGAIALAMIVYDFVARQFPAALGPHYNVRLAVGPAGGAGGRFAGFLVREWSAEHSFVRLLTEPTTDFTANATSLSEAKADIAIVRSDAPQASRWRALYTLENLGVTALAPRNAGAETFADLAGKHVAVVGAAVNDPLVSAVIAATGVGDKATAMASGEVGEAMRRGRVALRASSLLRRLAFGPLQWSKFTRASRKN